MRISDSFHSVISDSDHLGETVHLCCHLVRKLLLPISLSISLQIQNTAVLGFYPGGMCIEQFSQICDGSYTPANMTVTQPYTFHWGGVMMCPHRPDMTAWDMCHEWCDDVVGDKYLFTNFSRLKATKNKVSGPEYTHTHVQYILKDTKKSSLPWIQHIKRCVKYILVIPETNEILDPLNYRHLCCSIAPPDKDNGMIINGKIIEILKSPHLIFYVPWYSKICPS